ncbi:hypothetical protein BV898_01077 [Hypsibius exemplaris]|uniref:Uncharacterized protein n=1 Tax=Hypsibius exemplaris TaxID=2072580 RepID=A0A1W0XDC0_HYPEX|nr:hypothetical protein BV898_01077 [Hypsibius exemplaris]
MASAEDRVTRTPDGIRIMEELFCPAPSVLTESSNDATVRTGKVISDLNFGCCDDKATSTLRLTEEKPTQQQLEEDIGQPVRLMDPPTSVSVKNNSAPGGDNSAPGGDEESGGILRSLRGSVLRAVETLTGSTLDECSNDLSG